MELPGRTVVREDSAPRRAEPAQSDKTLGIWNAFDHTSSGVTEPLRNLDSRAGYTRAHHKEAKGWGGRDPKARINRIAPMLLT